MHELYVQYDAQKTRIFKNARNVYSVAHAIREVKNRDANMHYKMYKERKFFLHAIQYVNMYYNI